MRAGVTAICRRQWGSKYFDFIERLTHVNLN